MLQATIDALQATVDAADALHTVTPALAGATSVAAASQPSPTPSPMPRSQVATPSILPSSASQDAAIEDQITGCWLIKTVENNDYLHLGPIMCFMPDGSFFDSMTEGGRYQLLEDGILSLYPNPFANKDVAPISLQVHATDEDEVGFTSVNMDFSPHIFVRLQEDQNLKAYLLGNWKGISGSEFAELTQDGRILYENPISMWYAVFPDDIFIVRYLAGSPEIPENGGVIWPFRIKVLSDDAFDLVQLGWDDYQPKLVDGEGVSNHVTRIK